MGRTPGNKEQITVCGKLFIKRICAGCGYRVLVRIPGAKEVRPTVVFCSDCSPVLKGPAVRYRTRNEPYSDIQYNG